MTTAATYKIILKSTGAVLNESANRDSALTLAKKLAVQHTGEWIAVYKTGTSYAIWSGISYANNKAPFSKRRSSK